MTKYIGVPDHLPSLIDVANAPVAFGDRALPKIRRELNSSEILKVHRNLRSLSDMLHDPENIQQSMKLGIVEQLVKFLSSENTFSCFKSIECLRTILNVQFGKTFIIEQNYISYFLEERKHQDLNNRRLIHECIHSISIKENGQDALIGSDSFLENWLEEIENENDKLLKILQLETIHNCIKTNEECKKKLLELNCLSVFHRMILEIDDFELVRNICVNIFDVCSCGEGRRLIMKEEHFIEDLLGKLKLFDNNKLNDNNMIEFTSQIFKMFAIICITTEPKLYCYEKGLLDEIYIFMDNKFLPNSLLTNLIQLCCVFGEHPLVRKGLLGRIEEMKKWEESPNALVRKFGKIALEIVEWKP
ncbi:hypothetical protein SNEBB_007768 [Seison nebaliae]|nr:hypothetical protein SNEBB_007768 [Seison nebaliae]